MDVEKKDVHDVHFTACEVFHTAVCSSRASLTQGSWYIAGRPTNQPTNSPHKRAISTANTGSSAVSQNVSNNLLLIRSLFGRSLASSPAHHGTATLPPHEHSGNTQAGAVGDSGTPPHALQPLRAQGNRLVRTYRRRSLTRRLEKP